KLRTIRGRVGAIGKLAGEPQFAHGRLARNILFLAATDALLGALDNEVEELVGGSRMAGQPMVERILDRLLDQTLRFGSGEPVFGLALEFRLADENGEQRAGADHDIIAAHAGGPFTLAA